jgi:hypothetical protein
MRLRIEPRIIQELKRQLLCLLGGLVRLVQISSPQFATADPGKGVDVFGINPALRTISSQHICGGGEVIPSEGEAHVFNDAGGSREWEAQQEQKSAKEHKKIATARSQQKRR